MPVPALATPFGTTRGRRRVIRFWLGRDEFACASVVIGRSLVAGMCRCPDPECAVR